MANMTKRDICEVGIKLIGLCCLLIFIERVPSLINIKFLAGDQFTTFGVPIIIGQTLFFLLAIIFMIKGATIAGFLVGGDDINRDASQSTINTQELLSVAVKVLGMYWVVRSLGFFVFEFSAYLKGGPITHDTLLTRLTLLVIGCILVFGTRGVMTLISDKK
jgi:hypothetical protein